jgi:hypothetical protein
MKMTRKQTCYLGEGRLDPLPHHHLIILKRRFLSPLGILFPANTKHHTVSFTRRILSRIVSVATVHKDLASCSKLQRQDVQAASIAGSARQEGELDRYAGSCRKYLHLHSIEVTPLCDAFTSKLLASNYPAAGYANIVTYGNREAVEQVLGLCISLFENKAKLMKEAVGQISHPMKSAAESGAAHHPRHQTSLLHKGATRFEIAAEVKSRRKSGGDNFGISNLASAIISMTSSFQQVISDTVKRDNIVEHDPLLNSIGVGSEGIFSFSKSFANAQLATWII